METYLGIINVMGFILYCINMLLYKFTRNGQIDTLLTITSFLGGSLGIIIAILLFDRENVKDNMMSRVFVICMFIIQLILFIMLKGNHGEKITFAIWELFEKYKILLIYLGIINFITFTVFALDKMKAISGQWRYKPAAAASAMPPFMIENICSPNGFDGISRNPLGEHMISLKKDMVCNHNTNRVSLRCFLYETAVPTA